MVILHPRSAAHRRGPHAAVLLSSIAAAALGCGQGARPPGDGNVVRFGGDVVGSGARVGIVDSVPGDVMIAGSELRFTGTVGGDYLGAGGRQTVSGRVGGDVRAAGGEVRLAAVDVARNATVAGGQVTVGDGSVIGGNAYLAGGQVRVDGTVRGFLQAAGEEVVLAGSFGGDVNVTAERFRLEPGATIAGDLRHRVPEGNASIAPTARVGGRTVALPPVERPDFGFFRWLSLLGFLAAGAAAVALFPRQAAAAAERLRRRPGAAAGLGFLWVVAVPVAAAILAITLIGLPLALITAAVYAISLYLGRAVLAVWLGRTLLRGRGGSGRGGLVLGFLAGGVILLIIGRIPVAGAVVMIAATLLGLGALVLALRAPRAAPEAA